MKIIGEIPAREGSKRVPRKNLCLLNGKPLIQYAIDAAREAKTLTEVYVNSDSDEIGRIARASGVGYYKRPAHLGSDMTTQDEFNYDFIRAIQPDLLVMINPMAPLVETSDIDQMVNHFLENQWDTLVSVREEQVHAIYQGKSLNFIFDERLRRTQDLVPIQSCSWSLAIWRASTFVQQYETKGYAAFSGKVGFYPLNRFKSLKISTKDDFILAEVLVKNISLWKFSPIHEEKENREVPVCQKHEGGVA